MNIVRGILVVSVSFVGAASAFAQPSNREQHEPLPDGALWRLGTTRMRHLGEIRQLVFSEDGKHVASLGEDHAFALWDVKTGIDVKRYTFSDRKVRKDLGLNAEQVEMLILMGRRNMSQFFATSAEFGGDGKSLVISSPGKARVLDLVTHREMAVVTFKDEKPSMAALSPDGKRLARFNGSDEHGSNLSVFDVADGKMLHKLRLNPHESINLLRFSPDSNFLASANSTNQISLWDLKTGKRIRRFEMHDAITAMAFAPRGDRLASATHQAAYLWDFTSDEEIAKLAIEDVPASALAFSPDGSTLATSGKDHSILLWDLVKLNVKHQLTGLPANVSTLAFAADGKQLASATADGTLHLWNMTTLQQSTPVEHRPKARPIAFFAHDRLLVRSAKDGILEQIESASGKALKVLAMPTDRPGLNAVAPNGLRSAHADPEHGFVQLWDTEKKTDSHRLEGHGPAVSVMSFSPDSTHLATLSYDKNLRIWNTATGKQVRSVESSVNLPDDRMVIAFRGGRFREERVSTAQVVFSPDNRCIALVGNNGVASLIEIATGKERARIQLGIVPVSLLVIAPHGGLAATLSNDDVVRVWDTMTGKLVHGFVHNSEVKAAAFSAGGKLLAVGGANGVISLYDLAQDKLRRRFAGHRASINSIVFAPGGGPLFSSAEDGVMYFWDVNAPPIVEPVAQTPTETRLAALWDQLGHTDPVEGYKAINELVAHPTIAIQLVQSKLKPAVAVDTARVDKLIANLRSPNYAVREKASEELARLDIQVIPLLETMLRDKLSTEAKRRIEKIVESLDAQKATPENLRAARAIEALERIGTLESTAQVTRLAGGAPHAHLTTSAKEALQRLR